MRALLSTYGSRGDVEPMVGLAVQLRALGAEVRMCAPPDNEFAELLARVDVPVGVGDAGASLGRAASDAVLNVRLGVYPGSCGGAHVQPFSRVPCVCVPAPVSP